MKTIPVQQRMLRIRSSGIIGLFALEKNSVYSRRISSVGLNKIGDLYDNAGLLVFNMEPLRSLLSPCDMYLLISMLDAMPLEWRNLLNFSKSSIAHLTSPFEPNSFYILYENDIIPLEKVQSKSIYNKFVSKVCTKPTARKKYEESFNTEESQLDWKKIYLTPIRATLSTKLREFQYKILNRILYTNGMLFKFKKIESPLCYFCENVIETIEHFLFLCPRVQVFWNEVCSTFGEKLKWSRSLHIKDIFFGSQDLKIHNTLTNYIILESKYFLYRCKLNKTPLSILHFAVNFFFKLYCRLYVTLL